ncbi:nucleotide exchange factor GrpE [Marinobacteraceae bacterium S3BR75-40.1]
MSAEEMRNEKAHEEPETEAQEAEASAAGETGENRAEAATESGKVAELEEKLKEYQEQALRAQAEMQNVRRRAEIDVEKAHKFALEKFVKELLPVVDSLEKAIENSDGDEELLVRIREGVQMTLDMFLSSLGKFNVEQLNPVGEPFDPQMHEAMSMVPAPDAEPNTVVAVMQKGYTLNGRLVRPAMVVIAKPQEAPKVDEQA